MSFDTLDFCARGVQIWRQHIVVVRCRLTYFVGILFDKPIMQHFILHATTLETCYKLILALYLVFIGK